MRTINSPLFRTLIQRVPCHILYYATPSTSTFVTPLPDYKHLGSHHLYHLRKKKKKGGGGVLDAHSAAPWGLIKRPVTYPKKPELTDSWTKTRCGILLQRTTDSETETELLTARNDYLPTILQHNCPPLYKSEGSLSPQFCSSSPCFSASLYWRSRSPHTDSEQQSPVPILQSACVRLPK